MSANSVNFLNRMLSTDKYLSLNGWLRLLSKQIKIVYTQEEDDDTDLLRSITTQFLDSC